ncbi:MAG: sucrose phosphorylase, partial [Clostridium sp.]|nr:sucrose phosphorylase [Clostridium sp.]
YVGMLAGGNDIELMESTKNGRDINRHYYSKEEIKENFENRKIVNDIRDLMKFRNTNSAFGLDGECITEVNGSELRITRKCGEHVAVLKADLKTHEFAIEA